MILIAQISDLHLRPRGLPALGFVDTNALARRAVATLLALRPVPAAVLVTGDIADSGDPREYAMAREILSALPMPVHVIPGNHDRREAMREGLAGTGWIGPAGSGAINYAVDAGPLRLVCLDSLVEGRASGELGAETLAWLDTTLAEGSDRPTLVAVHHPPFNTGLSHMDSILLRDGAAVAGIVLVGMLELTVPQFFLALALANVLVASYIYSVVPEFLIRLLVWMLTHTMYRVKHHGMEHIPDEGPCMLVCNHVSYVDALLLAGAIRRPVRFVMFKPIYDMPLLNYIFRTGKTIPIDSKVRNPAIYERAFVRIREELEAGEVVCIFPEGKLTDDGEVAEFRAGIEKIVADYPVPVIPMALSGLWGSFFSHKGGKALTRLPRRFWSRIKLAVGEAVAPQQVRAEDLRERVLALRERP